MGKPGYIYIMAAGDIFAGHYKIGFSTDPKRRLKEVTRMPFPVSLIHHVPCEDMGEIESRLHEWLNAQRGRGEWFALTEENISEIKECSTESELIKLIAPDLVFPEQKVTPKEARVSTSIRWKFNTLLGQLRDVNPSAAEYRAIYAETGIATSTITAIAKGTKRVDIDVADRLLLFFSEKLRKRLTTQDLLEFFAPAPTKERIRPDVRFAMPEISDDDDETQRAKFEAMKAEQLARTKAEAARRGWAIPGEASEQ